MNPRQIHWIRLAAMALLVTCGNAAEYQPNPPPVRGFQEVGQVELKGGFWGPRIKTTH